MTKNINNKECEITTDFVICLGNACRPAHYLRAHNLRRCSGPLDWMMTYNLNTAINLFRNDFNNFFVDKEEILERTNDKFRCIKDTKNGIISIHGFPVDQDIDLAYESFSKTMARRYARMKKYLLASNHILIVSNRGEPIEDLENFLIEFHKLFKCKCTYLNIRNSSESKKIKRKISPELEIIEYNFYDEHSDNLTPNNPDSWLGNVEEWNKIMKSINLTDKFISIEENAKM